MYRRLFEEGGELLNLEIGTLSEFSHCEDVNWFLQWVQERQPGYDGIPLNECLVRRFSDGSGKDRLHRPDGPALIIEHMATGHQYHQLYAQNDLRHRIDGPALIADDHETICHEYWQDNKRYRSDGPDKVLIDNASGKIIDPAPSIEEHTPPEPP